MTAIPVRWLTVFLDFPASSFGAGGSGGHHLDLHVDPALASVEQAAKGAVALGAKVLHLEPGLVISSSPGGFTFCLVRWHGEADVPGPVRLDRERLNGRHAAAGARILAVLPRETEMADPVGRRYRLSGE